ncbi:MAG TPA: DUF2946 family protein [Noviherbaspirillum sp.]|nr:DUF2946 family protein [Noviherbaspirillum sp.]
MTRRTHRFAAWLACLAILLAALAPTVSIALSSADSDTMGEHCEVMGAMLAKAQGEDVSGDSTPARANLAFKYCPLCQVFGTQTGLLPSEPFEFSVVGRMQRLAFDSSFSSHAQSVWTAGQPRGPPVFS